MQILFIIYLIGVLLAIPLVKYVNKLDISGTERLHPLMIFSSWIGVFPLIVYLVFEFLDEITQPTDNWKHVVWQKFLQSKFVKSIYKFFNYR